MLTNLMAARMPLRSMRPAARALCLLFLCALAPLASASTSTVQVGKVSVEVPTPDGYIRITPEMNGLLERLESVTPATNVPLALYLSDQELDKALSGEPFMMKRYWAIQASKEALDTPFTPVDFARMKEFLLSQQQQIIERLKRDMPAVMNDSFGKISQELKEQARVQPGGIVTLPSHYDDATSMANSLVARVELANGSAQPDVVVVTVTYTIVNVGERLIFLYVYGQEDDLEWTREQAKAWSAAVVATNQPQLKKP
ncbi:MAG TPA: hypothetical protein VM469_12235 [Pseudoxanthomonas sp.]|nr:hypothetical protein [Pseudoxanthomonas sp.]